MSHTSRLTPIAALCALIMLAACQSDLATGDGAVASMSASAYLATVRSARGLPRLTADPQLEKAALQQSGYMARSGRMSHSARYGFAARMRDGGVEGAEAENIAYGRMEPGKVLDGWMHSSGHRRNMLDRRFTRYGLASVDEAGGGGRKYWTMVLGR